MRTFHFISGLPRTGSTLLCNILAQNPRFFTTTTSACLEALLLIRNNWEKVQEHKANLDWGAYERVATAALESFHTTDRPVIFDKSRAWLAYIEFVENLLQRKAKILVPVRPVVDILSSFETLFRKNQKKQSMPAETENYLRFQSIEGRCSFAMERENVVGLACLRIKEVMKRGLGDRLYFVDYDQLTTSPEAQMKDIYNFLEEKHFSHDFLNVQQFTDEKDAARGMFGLHTIRPKVEAVKKDARQILGDKVFERYANYKLL